MWSGPRLLIFLALASGGGSLGYLAYFLLVGPPSAIDLGGSPAARLAWDSLLCLVFFLQHSGMIRRGAKARLAQRVPAIYSPALYTIASGTALFAVILLWQPTNQFLFRLHGPLRWLPACFVVLALAGFIWGIHALRTFDPFGIEAVTTPLRGASPPAARFVVGGPYRYVRHPLYLFLLLLIWSTPQLSTDRLLFNVLWTAWIVVGATLEERDLLGDFGGTYRQYHLSVPMLLPAPRSFTRQTQSSAQSNSRTGALRTHADRGRACYLMESVPKFTPQPEEGASTLELGRTSWTR
jgi:protein-S-isoprenylcysteine O-methyltransferase Ste14